MAKRKIIERRVGNTTANIAGYVKVKSASGRNSLDCNDELARELRGMELAAIYKLAAQKLGESQRDLRARYKHLNVGMQAMNLRNRLRAAR
jgi:hypothetical protein